MNREIFIKEAECFGITPNSRQLEQLEIYKTLLLEWNEKINITAITDSAGIDVKHFLDSISCFAVEEFSKCDSLIDVGTGGGFPGLVMKIFRPDIEVLLLDSLLKRIGFLNEVISRLELKGVRAVHGRAEQLACGAYREQYDFAVSRAVAGLNVLCELCLPFVKVGGCFLSMKGGNCADEVEAAKAVAGLLGGKVERVIPVTPGGDICGLNHNLVVVKKIKQCLPMYPRKFSKISKQPLSVV